MLKQLIALCAAIFVVLVVGCEKSEPFTFDESVHIGKAMASSGDALTFSTRFNTFPNDQSGLYFIYMRSHPTGSFNQPPISIRIKIADLLVGCKALNYAPALPTGGAIEYPHAIATIVEGDQLLGDYMLREDKESQVCIDEIFQGGREVTGTFELHLFRERASFPWLETNWPDSLSLTEGYFRAYGNTPN